MPHRIQNQKKLKRGKHFIRQWREYRTLTQDQLAARLEMSKASLSRIENNKQPYTQDFLEACADALLTDPASLLIRNPLDKRSIWSIWDQVKPVDRKKVIHILEMQLKTGTK